jgi:hypothetical protein
MDGDVVGARQRIVVGGHASLHAVAGGVKVVHISLIIGRGEAVSFLGGETAQHSILADGHPFMLADDP